MFIPTYWAPLVVLSIVPATNGQNNLRQTRLFSTPEKEMVDLCFEVDICIGNSSEQNVLQNGPNGAGNKLMCCQGCYCRERCHDYKNCCYPDDNDDSFVEESTDCLYVQTGTPDETWPRNVPAYRIVSSAPKGGCVVNNTLSEPSIRDGVLPSCSKDPVALWGNLFPVYSKEHDTIYKNAECALCHNIIDVTPWLPILFCKDINSTTKVPISQQVQFLGRYLLTSQCNVAFQFSDQEVLENKRCTREIVSTCDVSPQINMNPAVTDTNLSIIDVKEACESGMKSPVRIFPLVYKNIYCFICNAGTMTCDMHRNQKTSFTGILSFVLDAVYFKTKNHDGLPDEKIPFPEACVKESPSLTSDRCRNIMCPSGQIRTRTGCKFPSKSWFVGVVSLAVQLKYPDSQHDNIPVIRLDMIERFLENKPWPPQWELISISHSVKSYPERAILLTLVSESNSPEFLFHSIKDSIGKQWPVNINGSSVNFEQSILKYSSKNKNWNFVVRNMKLFLPQYRDLTKLFVCEQVSLYSGEFELGENNTVLISNLTVRILYDMEFELVYNGNTTVWVCLSDTVFKTRADANGSLKEPRQGFIHFGILFALLLRFLF